jgi:DNA-directed RNA polymerase specialized sigma24 family protein
MSLYNQLYKHLNHLISTLSSCNFIGYDEKKDLVQDVILILYKRIEDGKLDADFDTIKGYSFITLQNACRRHHSIEQKRETPVAEFWEITDTSTTSEDEEYKVFLHNIVKSYAQQTKYSEMDKKVIELLLDDLEDTEIQIETGLSRKEITKHKFRVKTKMKFDYRRPVKYVIKHIENKNIQVPCFTLVDLKNYLTHIEPRRVIYMANDGWISPDGYYIETLIKRKRKKKNG